MKKMTTLLPQALTIGVVLGVCCWGGLSHGADLAVLQRVLDDKVFAKNQTYELPCLGVAVNFIP